MMQNYTCYSQGKLRRQSSLPVPKMSRSLADTKKYKQMSAKERKVTATTITDTGTSVKLLNDEDYHTGVTYPCKVWLV